jgi:signal transduction histidine kinase
METMRSRAALLGANFNLTSNIGEGTTLSIKYPYINEQ